MSEITIVRRARRLKESPPFSKIETTKEIKELPVVLPVNGYTGRKLDTLRTSPYVDFVPVQYLVQRNPSGSVSDEEYVNRNDVQTFTTWHISTVNTDQFKNLHMSLYGGGQDPVKYRGMLTLITENKAYVIAVVLPENVVYQKLYMLKNNTIDLNKVIVLVDRELDSTSFHNRRIREIYRKELLPLLMTTSCDVWRVPQTYIQESCFYGEFRLLSKTLMDRKRERLDIIQEFKNSQASIITSSGTLTITATTGLTLSGNNGTGDITAAIPPTLLDL